MPRLKYDVALSFAGEQRDQVKLVADELTAAGLNVFYDDYELETLWGKDLYQHLAKVYSQDARYCIVFASNDYAEKVWTTHELRNAQERAFLEKGNEYILPVRFDDTKIPGIPSTTGYLDYHKLGSSEIAKLAIRKLRSSANTDSLKDNDKSVATGIAGKARVISSSPRAYISSHQSGLVLFSKVVEASWGESASFVVEAMSSEADASFARLRSVTSDIVLAFGFDVALAQIISGTRSVKGGKPSWAFVFKIKRQIFEDQYEVGMGNINVDRLAEMRVERLLLNWHPAKEDEAIEAVDRFNDLFLESAVQGSNTLIKVLKSPLPDIWRELKVDPEEYLEIVWILLVAQLKLSSSVQDLAILKLSLTDSTLSIVFRGYRSRRYTNVEPHEINVVGSIELE